VSVSSPSFSPTDIPLFPIPLSPSSPPQLLLHRCAAQSTPSLSRLWRCRRVHSALQRRRGRGIRRPRPHRRGGAAAAARGESTTTPSAARRRGCDDLPSFSTPPFPPSSLGRRRWGRAAAGSSSLPGAPHGGGSEDPHPSGELPTVEPPHGEVGAQARGDGAPTSLCARQIRQRHIRSRGGHLRAGADGASSSNGVLPAPTAGRLLPRDRGAASIRSSMAAAMAPPHLPVRHRRASSRSRLGCRAPLLPAVAPPPSFAPHLSLPPRPTSPCRRAPPSLLLPPVQRLARRGAKSLGGRVWWVHLLLEEALHPC
jgi:hypothetical protein